MVTKCINIIFQLDLIFCFQTTEEMQNSKTQKYVSQFIVLFSVKLSIKANIVTKYEVVGFQDSVSDCSNPRLCHFFYNYIFI